MIAAWAVLWAAVLQAAEIDCSAVEPASAPDAAAARAYLDVGDAELKLGRADTAAVAFREALRLDPASAPARARLLELCAEAGGAGDPDFERAARAVEEGRYGEAEALLAQRYRSAAHPDPATALLYGIALYERGDDAPALVALERARESPETRDAAEVFVGLIALRVGDADRAQSLFERVDASAEGELGRTARDLSVLARREGRLAVSVQAEAGYDSNVDQAPDRTPVAGLSGDLLYSAMASALLRPFGDRGPYADGGARLRNLLEISEYDLGWVGGAAGWRFVRGHSALRLEYAYDGLWLGGGPFMSAHQLQLDARTELWGARLGGLLSARAETFESLETARYSGPTFDGEGSVGFGGGAGELRLRYRGELHQAVDQAVSWFDHGPGVRATAAFPSGRLVVDAQVTVRTYGAPELGFGNLVRQDAYLDGAVSVEQDLDRQLTFYLSIGGRKAFSNVPSLEYTRLAGSAGAIFTAGLW